MPDSKAHRLKVRKRTYAPKVKSGCKTCKIRRVKCDEAKPSCYRCSSTGRKCDYENSPPAENHGTVNQRVILLPKKNVSLFADNLEDCYVLHLFSHRTGPRIRGFFDRLFWTRVVIQLGYSEPAIINALRAVSAVYEQFDSNGGSEITSMNHSAVQAYNKALRLVNEELSSPDSRLYIPLVVCALFVCLEFLRGNHAAATIHIRGGITMLNDWRRKALPPASPESLGSGISISPTASELDLMDQLTAVYSRLRLQSGVSGKGPLLQPVPGEPHPKPTYHFRNMAEARTESTQLMNKSMDLVRIAFPVKYTGKVTADMFAQKTRYEGELLGWRRAMQEFLEREKKNIPKMEYEGAEIALIHNMCLYILTSLCFCAEEMQYDKFREEFEEIANKCAAIADVSSEFFGNHVGDFHYDMGLIAPLHLVGVRCRWPSIRQTCLKVLASHRWREGLFDSYKSYRCVKAIMDLEEAEKINLLGLGPAEANDYLPPEGARIHFQELGEVDPVTKRQVYTVFTKRYGPQGDWYSQKKSVSTSSKNPLQNPEEDARGLDCLETPLGNGPQDVPNNAAIKEPVERSNGMVYNHLLEPKVAPPDVVHKAILEEGFVESWFTEDGTV